MILEDSRLSFLPMRELDEARQRLSELDLRGLWLDGVRLGPTRFERSILSFANLRGVSIDGGSMRHALMHEADLRDADLTGLDASFVVGANMDLSGSNLRNSSWVGAYLRGARLDQVDLRGADLRAVSLAGARALDAQLSGTEFAGAVAPHASGLPDALRTMPLEALGRALGLGHCDWVYSAAFSGDGKRIVTASADNTARVWDAQSGRALTELVSLADGWFSLHYGEPGAPPRFRAAGAGLNVLRYRDRTETPKPAPWIPREWMAADLLAELGMDPPESVAST